MNIKNWEDFIKDIPTNVLVAELERRNENKNNLIADPVSSYIMKEIDTALTRFGDYTFGDKGPYEVMNISNLVYKIKDKPVKEVANILTQVLDNYDKISKIGNYDHAISTVNTIIGELDSMEWFDDLFDYDNRFEY